MTKPPVTVAQSKPAEENTAAESIGGEQGGASGSEGGKSPLKKPLGLSLRKPSTDAKPAPTPKTPIEEAIELALASASTAVDSAQEIQRLRNEVQTIITASKRSNMILFYSTILVIVFASAGLFGALVFYKRSYNEFEAVAKVNRDALLAFAGEINGLVATSRKIEESVRSSERSLTATTAQSEELKKAMQGFTSAHNALTAKIPTAGAYDKPMAALKQSMDDLTSANKAIGMKLAEMQQAQVVRDQAPPPPPPPVEKPRVEAVKKPVNRTQSVQSGRDSLIRYP